MTKLSRSIANALFDPRSYLRAGYTSAAISMACAVFGYTHPASLFALGTYAMANMTMLTGILETLDKMGAQMVTDPFEPRLPPLYYTSSRDVSDTAMTPSDATEGVPKGTVKGEVPRLIMRG